MCTKGSVGRGIVLQSSTKLANRKPYSKAQQAYPNWLWMRDCQLSPITKWEMQRHIKTRQAAVKCTRERRVPIGTETWLEHRLLVAWWKQCAGKRFCDLLAGIHKSYNVRSTDNGALALCATAWNLYINPTKKNKLHELPVVRQNKIGQN